MAVTGFDNRNIIGAFDIASIDAFERSWASAISFYNGASDRATEEYGILGANSEMREWVGARQGQILNKKTYSITNSKYEATLPVPKEEVQRDKSGLLQARMGTFAMDVTSGHWETLSTDLLNSNGTAYDGIAYYSASHVWGSSGTQKNLLTSSEVASLGVTTATAPTPYEMANAILGCVGHMLTFRNDKGRLINGSARSFVIQVATIDLFASAVIAVGNAQISDGSGAVDNPLNGLKQKGFTFDVRLNPDLTSATDKLFIFRTDGPLGALILQDEQAPEVDVLGPGSDYYVMNDAYLLAVNARRGAGYGFWEYSVRGTFS